MANPPIIQTKMAVSPVKGSFQGPPKGPFQGPFKGPASMGGSYTNRTRRHEIREAKRHGDWDWFGGPAWPMLWLEEAYAVDLFEEEEAGLVPPPIDLWP